MVKKIVMIVLMLSMFLGLAVPAYCDGPIKKLGRGICNVATFPFEMVEQMKRVNNYEGPGAAATYGVLKGLYMMVARAGVGVYEIVTFPIPVPPKYAPILKDPEFFFDDMNW